MVVTSFWYPQKEMVGPMLCHEHLQLTLQKKVQVSCKQLRQMGRYSGEMHVTLEVTKGPGLALSQFIFTT